MVIFQNSPEETRERSFRGVQGRNVTNEYPGGSHSRVYDDWHGNFRQRGRSSNASRARQSTERTNSTAARGFVSSELVLTDEHQSGLERYGRLVGSSGEPSTHSHFLDAKESSHFTTGSNNSYNQLDTASYFNVDSGLENYGKYLGSSPEPGYGRDSNPAESLRNHQNASRSSGTLSRDEWCQACSKLTFKNGKGRYTPANWTDPSDGSGYRQSANVAPSSYVPVLLRNKSGVKRTTEGEEKPSSPFSIEPMVWGLIPPFYQGSNPAGHGFKTNNCRIEGIDTKNTYKPSLHKGQRCVVLSDGFYEWETTKMSKTKQPYFIYVPQEEGVEIWNRKSWERDDLWTEEEGWKGPKILKMAGLYSEWTSTEGIRTRSFSIITMESGKEFSKLHHRIPAILETDEQVEEWLDSGTFGYKEALQKLNSNPSLTWHPVSSDVNYSKNQDINLNYPVDTNKKPETGSSKFMSQWLSKGSSSPKKLKDKPQGPPPKKENTLDKWFKRENKEVTKNEEEAD